LIHIEFILEEASTEAALQVLVPKMIKNLTGFENLSGLGQNIYLNSYIK